jgi:hypothetical protein
MPWRQAACNCLVGVALYVLVPLNDCLNSLFHYRDDTPPGCEQYHLGTN